MFRFVYIFFFVEALFVLFFPIILVQTEEDDYDEDEYDDSNSNFEFPAKNQQARYHQNQGAAQYNEFHDSNWDDFFTGLSDNIDKDIHNMAKQNGDPVHHPIESDENKSEDYTVSLKCPKK